MNRKEEKDQNMIYPHHLGGGGVGGKILRCTIEADKTTQMIPMTFSCVQMYVQFPISSQENNHLCCWEVLNCTFWILILSPLSLAAGAQGCKGPRSFILGSCFPNSFKLGDGFIQHFCSNLLLLCCVCVLPHMLWPLFRWFLPNPASFLIQCVCPTQML